MNPTAISTAQTDVNGRVEVADPFSISAPTLVGRVAPPPSPTANTAPEVHTDLADVAVGQLVRGRYRVSRMWRIVRVGAPTFWVVQLVDGTGGIRGYGWPDKVAINSVLSEGTLVDVEFAVKLINGPQAKLCRFAPVSDASAVDLFATLPTTTCPVSGIVHGIHNIVRSVRTPVLQRFLAKVFGDFDLCRRYFQVPASFDDHHAWPGGMAEHCLDGAEMLSSVTGMEYWMRELGIVSFLVHDIGKTWTNSKLPSHFECYHLIEHDDLSLEILADALHELDRDWPDGGLAIRHCLTCASPGSRYGKIPATPLAELVHAVDRVSRLKDLVARFCVSGGDMHKLKSGQRIWQPAAPQEEGVEHGRT